MEVTLICSQQTARRKFFRAELRGVKLRGAAFGEVAVLIEETLLTATAEIPMLKLSDLIKLYTWQLSALGVHLEKILVQNTRFKNRLFSQFEAMSVYKDEKEVILIFNHDVGKAISVAAEANYDDHGYILGRAANIM